MKLVKFIKLKTQNASFAQIARLELESWVCGLIRPIPGGIGMLIRSFTLKLFFKNHRGISLIQHGVTWVDISKISIGERFGCNSGSYINGVGGIQIGDDVLIGNNVTISSGRHPHGGRAQSIFSRAVIPEPIVIEDDVWIGAGAVIMPGIVLRKGSVIGALSVVTKSTEEYGVYVGAPARKQAVREV
jgi:maltose O-acetyltransferase